MTTDLELLRAYEPVIRYTAGELFFPTAVEPYVAECDLLVGSQEGHARLLASHGELDTSILATQTAPPGETLYLRLVQEPLGGFALAQWSRRPDRPVFRAPGRLARVGLFARLVDAGFNASLLLRGKVPGGTAAAASVKYEAARAVDPRFVYHGRAVRRDGWIVLHYLYFYFMNDWRSTFAGANDHEADLEQAFVVLEDRPDGPRPVWFGCAAHDYSGDELRRRWDDPYISLVGDHPVIHAGAGSHAAYFEAGEYITTVPLPAFRGVQGFFDYLRHVWRDTLRQGDPGDLGARVAAALSIPFIDYARGDGLAIGPEQGADWSVVEVDDDVPWVDGYRGLWGLDTRDRFAGERAPAGLKYTRTGSVRPSWNDPIGFLGLDKVAPPFLEVPAIDDRVAKLEAEEAGVDADIAKVQVGLPGLDQAVRALGDDGSLERAHRARTAELAEREAEVARLRARKAELRDELQALAARRAQAEAGDRGDPRAHLSHDHHPQTGTDQQYGRVVEFWSAISVSLALIALIALIYVTRLPTWAGILFAVVGYFALEAVFRRRLIDLLLRLTLLMALLGAVILAVSYATQLVVLAIAGVAILTLIDNVREIRAS
ncbi:MAG TPA: hypothetical protein VLR93_08220 [Patescibacteria group bacterium]|nr:hypothetical protein [Patescibacteria group bacterium]